MSKELNELLEKAYHTYKDDPQNSPIPLKIIKEFLEMEGISIGDY